jgi:biotin carboxyl carrier protein
MAKLYVNIPGKKEEVMLERTTPSKPWTLANGPAADLVRVGPGRFSVLVGGKSFSVIVLKEDRENKTLRLRIGAHTCTARIEEEQDRLLQTLGANRSAQKAGDLKAPMPGLVLSVLVKPGDRVKRNDPVLVLEAMKMENLIKAPADAEVKAVLAEKGRPVEKGQPLIQFA